VTTSFLSTATVTTCYAYSTQTISITSTTSTSSSITVSVCTPSPTVLNGDFETGSLQPWTHSQTSDSRAIDSRISVTSLAAFEPKILRFDAASVVLSTDQGNSLTFTNTVHGLCGAGNQFRVSFDYYCQAQDFDTSIAAYIDGTELYASSCNFPGSWQTDNFCISPQWRILLS
jgi:hypothetical protein